MKTKPTTPRSIDEYIGRFPAETRKLLERLRKTIRAAAPGAEETISYQIPTFKDHGALVHFAAWKNHIGFYPRHPEFDGSGRNWPGTAFPAAPSTSPLIVRSLSGW